MKSIVYSIVLSALLASVAAAGEAARAHGGLPSAERAGRPAIQAVTFADINAGLIGAYYSALAWGDYDSDGDMDLVLMGESTSGYVTRVYRNDGSNVFADINAGLPGLRRGACAWGDYDNDGDLDLLATGWTGSANVSRVFRNSGGGVFTDIGAGLIGVAGSSVAWGDYDNDGDLDILLAGNPGADPITRVYRNNGGLFADINAGLPGTSLGTSAWGDYDNDGDLDILVTGATSSGSIARVYRNDDNGAFTDIGAGLPGLDHAAAAWGDYDADGDLDLILTGFSPAAGASISRVYRNDGGGTFTDVNAGLTGVSWSAVAWGDYDNDGDLDLLVLGWTDAAMSTRVYRCDGGALFTNIGAALPNMDTGAVAWADFDADGDLDILLSGQTGTGLVSRVYRSDGAAANAPSAAPAGLASQVTGNRVTLSWHPASDGQTPAAGLSYNIQLGTTPGGSEVLSPMANAASGYRKIVQPGNAQQRTSWTITLPSTSEPYYWSVQAIDGAFAGSPFSTTEQILGITFTHVTSELPAVDQGSTAWGDYDNDGDLDILLTGWMGTTAVSFVYRNNGDGTFTHVPQGLAGVMTGSSAWGDYDNDGDLDILLTGWTGATAISRIYRNDGNGSFTDSGVMLPGVRNGSVAWGDYDGDGSLDFMLMGEAGTGVYISRVYRNNGSGTFNDLNLGLPGMTWGSVAWGDYDSDHDLDILQTGWTGSAGASVVYRNNGNHTFVPIAGLQAVYYSTGNWGDYDNDGDMDVLLTGWTGAASISRVYRNNGNATFTNIPTALLGVSYSSSSWADYDNDGDLDILLTGNSGSGFRASNLYRSDGAPANSLPGVPSGLQSQMDGEHVILSWHASADGETPAAGLSYNVRLGTTPGGNEVCPSMANSASGYRRVVQLGNAQQRTWCRVRLPLTQGHYWWSVQAVDAAYAGSPFAEEEGFGFGFTDVNASLPILVEGTAGWGDYDNDGDLDILLTGASIGGGIARVYRNDGGGSFIDIAAGLPGVFYSASAWGDYDNDGDLDILLGGSTGSASITRVFRNDNGGTFTDVAAGLPEVSRGAAVWGDHDNDGDLDILLTGWTGSSRIARVYRNEGGGTFTDVAAGLPGVSDGAAAWGDYDNDGDLDVLLTGATPAAISRVYRNEGGGAFTDAAVDLPGVYYSSAAWGDYDNDGDLDILLAGNLGPGLVTRVYRNDGGGVFTDIVASLPGVRNCSAAWGDYDNDGNLDILLAGWADGPILSRVYRNDGEGVFSDIAAGLPGVRYCSAAWGDYDNDGDLDVVLAGDTGAGYFTRVYRSDGAPSDTPPTAPAGLSTALDGNRLTLSWNASTDNETPTTGLSYNLRIGTTPGGSEIAAAMSNAVNGCRRVAQLGNAQQRTSWTVTLPPSWSAAYWSVQSVDAAFCGSPFAAEQSLTNPLDVATTLPREPSFALEGANPVMGVARFRFGLPARARVELAIYDVSGRRVSMLESGEHDAGYHSTSWRTNEASAGRSSGVYFARFSAGRSQFTQRIVVLR